MKEDNFSIYRMENNHFLGDCLVIVYHATSEEMNCDSLTSPDVSIYIKTKKDIFELNSVADIRNNKIFDDSKTILLRIASECQFGTFGDSHCDCESQKNACLEAINEFGQGIYVQLPQDGQGRGLHYKANELQIQINGYDKKGKNCGKKNIYEAAEYILGTPDVDIRGYKVVKQLFKYLRLSDFHYTFLGTNPKKINTLANQTNLNIIKKLDVKRDLNIDNLGEYLAKIYKKSFSIPDDEMNNIYNVILSAKHIPERVLSLINCIREDVELGKKFNVNMNTLGKILKATESKEKMPASKLFGEAFEQPYNEYQVEVEVSEEDFDKLITNDIISNLEDFSFEQNYYYDLVYFRDTIARNLKIRRKNKVGGDKKLIESRLIYKTKVDDNEYSIKNICVTDSEVADLLTNSLEGYKIFYVPVFVHTCETANHKKLTVLLKRYSKNLRTLSIMGPKENVLKLLDVMKKTIEVKIIPDPTYVRNLSTEISFDFDYETLATEEINIFKKYYRG